MRTALQVMRKKGEITEDPFRTGMKNVQDRSAPIKLVKYIDLEKSPGFIRSVMLHPRAPDWFSETLSTYCKSNGLNYLGNSTLYKLDVT